METLRKLLKELDDKSVSSIYLREIALLMEQIEFLKLEVDQLKKELKNSENKNSEKNK